MSVQQDPFAAAVNDAQAVNHLFGQMTVDAQFAVWRDGKTHAWFETDGLQDRIVVTTFSLNPLSATGMTKMIEKQNKSTFGDFARIVWPSLKKLGCNTPKDVDNKFVHVELVPQKPGSDWTVFKFLNVYNTEAECEAAYYAFKGQEAHSTPAALPPVSQVKVVNEAEKAAALQFLSHVVLQNKGDLLALDKALKTTPLVKDYFTVNSPEVLEILTPFGA